MSAMREVLKQYFEDSEKGSRYFPLREIRASFVEGLVVDKDIEGRG